MPADLKQQEEELKLLIKKVDSEIAQFEKLKTGVSSKRSKIEASVKGAGLQPVPIEVLPHSGSHENLEFEISRHILELNKLKNFINSRLDLVMREEELMEELKKKHGSSVKLKRTSNKDFEITVSDAETKKAFEQLKKGKKLLSMVKGSVQKLTD